MYVVRLDDARPKIDHDHLLLGVRPISVLRLWILEGFTQA